MIVGQEHIISLIDKSTVDTFPKSLILLGEYGSGKHTISDYISNRLNLTLIDITENLNLETIEEIGMRVEPYIYLINGKDISIKEQNTILKFLEEPLKNSFIIILCENKNQLLNTVLNRCQVWELRKYPKQLLEQFIENQANKELILKVATTPGQVKSMDFDGLSDIFSLAMKIINKISGATLPNTLTLANKLAFKGEKDKINVYVFMLVLLDCYRELIIHNDNIKLYEAYTLTKDFVNNQYIANINKKHLFENYLIQLRNIMRGENQ